MVLVGDELKVVVVVELEVVEFELVELQTVELESVGVGAAVAGVVGSAAAKGVAVDGAGEGVAVDGAGEGVGMGTAAGSVATMSGMVAGTGCAACVVVLSAGANALASIASRLNGHIPVFRKALLIVVAVKALSRARE